MNTQLDSQPRPPTAFTLIELLVVIAIIGVLAGLMLPVGARIKQTAQRNKARAELEQIAFAEEPWWIWLNHQFLGGHCGIFEDAGAQAAIVGESEKPPFGQSFWHGEADSHMTVCI